MKEKEEDSQNELLGRLFRMAGARAPVPEETRLRVKEAVHGQWRKGVRKRKQNRVLWLFQGALAASLLVYGLSWRYLVREAPVRMPVGFVQSLNGNVTMNSEGTGAVQTLAGGEMLLAGKIISSDGSGQALLHLLNGTTVRVDVNSRLHFKSESSIFLDQGAVYLDCGRSSGSIELVTSLGTIKDLGTQFEVRLHGGGMRVTVREGSVFLEQQGASRTVVAGKQLTIDPKGAASYGDVATYGPQWTWVAEVTPVFRIEGRSLMEFLDWLTRENGWSLEFADPRLRNAAPNTVLHGSILGLQPEEMPGAVLPVCGLTFTLEHGVLTVRPGKVS